MESINIQRKPWAWIPSLYFAEGMPYAIVVTVAVLMYKRLGLSNTDAVFYTSWFSIPWIIKPFWSPIVEILRSNRWWIITTQMLIGASMAGVALTLQAPNYIQWSLCCFWIIAFSSATHDIAADGFYIQALSSHEQALYVGIRSTLYRLATMFGQGLLVMAAGLLEVYTRAPRQAWGITMGVAAFFMLSISIYHKFMLPYTIKSERTGFKQGWQDFTDTILDFFNKPGIIVAIIFLLTYRLPEALLGRITPLFMLEVTEKGGMAMTTAEIGLVQGTIGLIGLILGGILGGVAIAHNGFKKWLWPMVMSMSIPNLLYVALAYYQPEQMWFFMPDLVVDKIWIVAMSYFIEQFGYGFGFTAYMLFMIHFSQGTSATAHYAFCTGFMALSLLPGAIAGWLQESLGYYQFFVVVMALTPLTFIAASIINVPSKFGQKI